MLAEHNLLREQLEEAALESLDAPRNAKLFVETHLALHKRLADYKKSNSLYPLIKNTETWKKISFENLSKVLEFSHSARLMKAPPSKEYPNQMELEDYAEVEGLCASFLAAAEASGAGVLV